MATINPLIAATALSAQTVAQQRSSRPALPFSITGNTSDTQAFSGALATEMLESADGSLLQASPSKLLPGETISTPSAVTTSSQEHAVSAAEADKIDSTARDLESVLVYTMLKEMWATLPKDGMLDTGTGSKFYREMWLEEISKRMSQVGSGLGIASVVKRELMDRASREVTPSQLSSAK
jgi:hypothetical protein